jgi:hypothetical protein
MEVAGMNAPYQLELQFDGAESGALPSEVSP